MLQFVQCPVCYVENKRPLYDSVENFICHHCSHEWNQQEVTALAYENIQKLRLSVSSFDAGEDIYELDFVQSSIHFKRPFNQPSIDTHGILSEKELKRIRKRLIQLDVLNWSDEYIMEHVLDGTMWSLQIDTPFERIEKHGHQEFPKQWDSFVQCLENIRRNASI